MSAKHEPAQRRPAGPRTVDFGRRDAAILIAMSHAADGPKGRILQLGPLHSVHLARWAEIAAELGWRVVVAGHQRTPMALATPSADR